MLPGDIAHRFITENYTKICPHTGEQVKSLHEADGQYWVWNGSVYEAHSKDEIGDYLLNWMNASPHITATESIFRFAHRNLLARLRSERGKKLGTYLGERPSTRWLACINGIIDLDRSTYEGKITLEDRTPRLFTRVRLPHKYDPYAACPVWLQCLNEWMDGDQERIDLLQEFVGYCLTTDTSFCSGLFLDGLGSNGKSVFIDTVSHLLSEDNVTNVELDQLHKDFALEKASGYLLNVSSETEQGKIPTASIKKIIDGNRLRVTRKWMSNVDAKPTIKLIIAWNKRPLVEDRSYGFWRRILLVPFRRTYKPGEGDPFLLSRLKREASGILNWAVGGHLRLYANKQFTRSIEVEKATQAFRDESDTVGAWVRDCLRFEEESRATCNHMYSRYKNWCDARNYESDNDRKFWRNMQGHLKNRKKSQFRDSGVPMWGYNGIRILDVDQDSDS